MSSQPFAAKDHHIDMKRLQISIPSPCHENWAAMAPAEKGRFCTSCQKKVHDFTGSSDREIASVLSKQNDVCGRYLNTQLNRDLVVPIIKNTTWMAASAAVLSFFTLGVDAATHKYVATEQTPAAKYGYKSEKMTPGSSVITGQVFDNLGLPLPGAHINLEGTNVRAQSDLDGRYSILGQKGQVLIISYIGLKTEVIHIGSSTTINITLTEEVSKQEVIVIGYRNYRTKVEDQKVSHTFFRRIFHSLGNIFRK